MLDFHSVERLAQRAIASGRAIVVSPGYVRWDIGGACEAPVLRKCVAVNPRPIPKNPPPGFRDRRWIQVDLGVPCRACKHCLRKRTWNWKLRGVSEWRDAEESHRRSWLGTLTLRPEAQYLMRLRAARAYEFKHPLKEARLTVDGTIEDAPTGAKTWDQLTPEEHFRLTTIEASKEVTKYLKKVRNYRRDRWRAEINDLWLLHGWPKRVVAQMRRSGFFGEEPPASKFRYYLTAEAHKSGNPHFHIVFHENDSLELLHDQLSCKWELGFTKFKLVKDKRGAEYAAKYLAKTKMARVRASIGYGRSEDRTVLRVAYYPTTATAIGQPAGRPCPPKKPLEKGGVNENEWTTSGPVRMVAKQPSEADLNDRTDRYAEYLSNGRIPRLKGSTGSGWLSEPVHRIACERKQTESACDPVSGSQQSAVDGGERFASPEGNEPPEQCDEIHRIGSGTDETRQRC